MPESNLMTVHEPKFTTTPADVERFAGLVSAGVKAWAEAGELLVKMKDEDDSIFERIIEKYPGISWDILTTFENIGRKRIYPFLMLDNCPGSKKLMLLPYEDQVRFYQAKIDVVVRVENGQPVVEKKRLQQLSKPELDRLFFGNRIKSIPEQAADFKLDKKYSATKKELRQKVKYFDQLINSAKPLQTPADNSMEEDLRKVHKLLSYLERHCPCGARPESPNSHPHVTGCYLDQALSITRKYL